jgi:hypothetical protein
MTTCSTMDSSTPSASVSIWQIPQALLTYRLSPDQKPKSVLATLMTVHFRTDVLVFATGTSTGMMPSTSARGAHTGATMDVTATDFAKHPNL